MPVDVACLERLEKISELRRWSAFSYQPTKIFRVDDNAWKELFSSQSIPEEAKKKLRTAGVMFNGKYSNKSIEKMDRALYDVDVASRTGLKFASSLLLFAEVLHKSYQQADSAGVSRKNTGSLVTLLGPISRLIYDQFSRISIKVLKSFGFGPTTLAVNVS